MAPLRVFQFLLAFFIVFSLSAQHTFVRNDSIKVFSGGGELLNPWGGGFNATQFSELDIDLDGIKDIVAFDKGSFKIRCYRNTGSSGFTRYKHAPRYEGSFPDVSDWALFVDYNNDGKNDLFSYAPGGIKVFKNTSSASSGLQFTLAYSLLYSNYQPTGAPYWLNLYVSPVGLPAVSDIDNDGDLDILSFDVFGTTVEYHQNQAVEQGLPSDSLKFFMVDDCWGNFSESTCATNLGACPLFGKWNDLQNPAMKSNLHAGSCLMCLDNDGDGDKDLLLGDISCDSIEFYKNGLSTSNANIDSATKYFPSSKPVKIPYYPCTYFVDTDNDGNRDLLVSPNITPSSENFQSAWRYKNTGSDSQPVFTFLETNFLQDSMIDLGEGSFPALVDENADGLPDLVVGNYGYFNNPNYNSRLALIRNTGTAATPQFTIINRNYANFSAYSIQSMAPGFGDLDSDGDMDLLIGDFDGKLTHFENVAGPGNALNLVFVTSSYKNIDVGQNAMPQIVDVDRDGLKDLLIGSRNGKVYYYKNIGTSGAANFSSTPTSNFFGGVSVVRPGYLTGYAAPCLMDRGGTYELLVGSERGYIYRFGNIDGNLTGNFTLIDSIGWGIRDGGRLAPVAGNIDNDNMQDLIVGNYDGGLSYYAGDSLLSGIHLSTESEGIKLFPNPAASTITVSFGQKAYAERLIEIVDATGRVIHSVRTVQPVAEIDLSGAVPGFYFLTVKTNKEFLGCRRFVISK